MGQAAGLGMYNMCKADDDDNNDEDDDDDKTDSLDP